MTTQKVLAAISKPKFVASVQYHHNMAYIQMVTNFDFFIVY